MLFTLLQHQHLAQSLQRLKLSRVSKTFPEIVVISGASPQSTFSGGFIGTDTNNDFIIKTNDVARWAIDNSTGDLNPTIDGNCKVGTATRGASEVHTSNGAGVNSKFTHFKIGTVSNSNFKFFTE